ncbi:DUF5367 family protein [Lysinibacillus telephonicus]|uniref:DUF5367 family protein n=1 Tax=Lysinibacillus telephonicus TaxID=1714840 RepID=UPI0031FBCB03
MNSYLKTSLFGFIVWLFATLFFVLFGEYVLYAPGSKGFLVSLTLLLLSTGALLYFATRIYMLFDKTKHAPLKFGLVGTIIGLTLDMFSISNYKTVFPSLEPSQVISFTAWMSFAYALYLIIPIMMEMKTLKTNEIKI